MVRRWRDTTRGAGDSLRGEYLNRLCGLLFIVTTTVALVLVPGARLFGVDPPRSLVMGLGYAMLACAVGATLSGIVSWVERRAAARRDAQLGITDVKPRRLPVGVVAYLGAVAGIFIGILIAFGIVLIIWAISPELAVSMIVDRTPPMWLAVVVVASVALSAGSAGVWQFRRK